MKEVRKIQIQDLIEKVNPDQIIAFGDWNVNEFSPKQRQMFFNEWLENNAVRVEYPDKPTHRLYTTGRESYLDGIIISSHKKEAIVHHETLTEEVIKAPIPSDHNPIWARIRIDVRDETSSKGTQREPYMGNRVKIIPERIEEWNRCMNQKLKTIEPYDERADNMRLKAISDIIMTSCA